MATLCREPQKISYLYLKVPLRIEVFYQGLWKSGTTVSVSIYQQAVSIKLINSESWRIQPIVIEVKSKRLLVINCYFPTDKRNNDDICPELEECLAEISNIIQSTNFTDLRISGDLNFEATRQTSNANMIRTFLTNHNLCTAWDTHAVDYTYIFETENGDSRRTTIDHFIGLRRDVGNILEANAIHRVEDCSVMRLSIA